MPLLNYTTEVPASRSIAEITRMLQDAGASAIMLRNNAAREICAVSFMLQTPAFGQVSYTIPANVPAVILALNEQIKTEARSARKRLIPRRLYNNKEQAERIAWRIAKDWLEAQLALQAIGSALLEQIMLPFADAGGGQSFYDRLVQRGSLALPSPRTEPEKVTEV